jgi:hypothetical protein
LLFSTGLSIILSKNFNIHIPPPIFGIVFLAAGALIYNWIYPDEL